MAAAAATRVGVDVDLEVVGHLRLDSPGVDVLLVDPVAHDVGVLGSHGRRDDLDVNGAGVALILGNGRHGEAVGVLLAAHKRAGPGVQPVGGRLEVDVVGVQVGPVPVPVDGVDRAGLQVAGQLDGRLAAELDVVDGALGGQLSGSLKADRTVVGLVALAVVVVSRGQENAAAVAAGAVLVPDEVHVEEALAVLGLAGAVQEDGAAVLRLLGLVLRQRRVAVLQVDEGYVVARCGFQHRERRVLLQLVLVQHLIPREGALTRGRQNPLRDAILEDGVSRIARNPAARIALGADHGAVRGDLEGTLDPGVGIGHGGERRDKSHFEAHARFGSHLQC